MRKLYTSLFAVAVAAMAFTSCSKDETVLPDDLQGNEITLNLVADSQIANATRTEYDQTTNNIKWSATEFADFYANGVRKDKCAATVTGNTATFAVKVDAGENLLTGVYPTQAEYKIYNQGNVIEAGATTSDPKTVIALAAELKDVQTITTASFDPTADILIVKPQTINVTDATAAQDVSVQFGRPVAITELTLKGFTPEAGEKVQSVEFALGTAQKYLAGYFLVNPTTNTFVQKTDGKTQVADPASDIFYDQKTATITMNYATPVALENQLTAWMVSAPITLAQNDDVIVKVTTDKRVLQRALKVPAQAQLMNNKHNKLPINMASAEILAVNYACDFESADFATSETSYSKVMQFGPNEAQWNLNTGRSTTTKSDVLSGVRSLQSRSYAVSPAPADPCIIEMLFDVTKTKYVTLLVKGDKQIKIQHSIDKGQTWKGDQIVTATTKTEVKHIISEGAGVIARIRVSMPDNAKGDKLTIDDVKFFGETGGGIVKREPLVAPQNLMADWGVELNTIDVVWDAVTGAKDYTVSCDHLKAPFTVTEPKATVHVPAGEASYTISVVANPADDTKNIASEAATCVVENTNPILEFASKTFNVKASDTSLEILFQTIKNIVATDLQIAVNPEATWLQAGLNTAKTGLALTMEANTDTTASREATITISYAGMTDVVLTVTQAEALAAGEVVQTFTATEILGETASQAYVNNKSITKGDATILFSQLREWGGAVRMYKNQTIKISTPTGKEITKIEFAFGGKKSIKPNTGTLDTKGVWTPNAQTTTNEVVFSTVGTKSYLVEINSIKVTYK